MKLGFFLRKLLTKIEGFIRHIREMRYYFKDWPFENSIRKGDISKIKSLLTIQKGALGDTYNFIGILNQIAEDHPKLKIYCITNEKSKDYYKNPRLNAISAEKAEKLITNKKINALVTYGSIDEFIQDKRLFFKIPYRSGKLFPYKTRPVPDELLSIFNKLGFKVDNLKFHFTEEGEKTAKRFYKENNLKKPLIFLQVGTARTLRAMKEGLSPQMWPFLWPPENWARVADYLIEKYKGTIIFIGVKDEKPLIKDVIQKTKHKDNILNIVGKFSIEETASIVKRGDLVAGTDCGITHILSQIGIPVLVLISGNPKISSPYKSINVWNPQVCNGCRKYYCPENNAKCINSIKVKDVIKNLPIKPEITK